MGRIYISSDLHLGHDKEFIWKARGFSSIEEHDAAIISSFNEVVQPEDTLILLGDNMLGDNDAGIKKFHQLPAHMWLVYGNHDSDARQALYEQSWNVDRILGYASILKYDGFTFYLSHYPTLTGNFEDEHKYLKQQVINLCGHTHTTDRWSDIDKGLIYHCEVDAHGMKPVLLDDIIDEFIRRRHLND